MIVTLLSYKDKYKGLLIILIAEYLFLVLSSTLFCRSIMPESRLELSPFWTYHAALIDKMPGISVWDIVLNVVLFFPLGFLVKLLYPTLKLWKLVIIAICTSVFIETNQYLFEKGIAQFDDVMHNTIGAMIGWGVVKLVQGTWLKIYG